MRFAALVGATVAVSALGCSAHRMYPVCFYGKSAPDASTVVRHVDALSRELRKRDANAHGTADGRWLFARTSRAEHERLIETWPRAACIGPVSAGTEVKANADCVAYVAGLLATERYNEFGVAPDPVHTDEAPGPEFVICYREPSTLTTP